MSEIGPVGVLSDSHGRARSTARGVAALRDAGATLLIHLGDIGSEAVLDELAGTPARIVFGNCDHNDRELRRYAEILGIAVDHPLGRIEIAGRRIAYTHGHDATLMERAQTERPDYLFYGHTHLVGDDRVDGVRWINPGALFRASRYTVALLDPGLDELRILEVARD